jgi:hypothetical protein
MMGWWRDLELELALWLMVLAAWLARNSTKGE